MRKLSKDFEISFYEKIVREKPDYVEALTALAGAYTAKGFYEKGLAIDKRLARLCGKDPVVFYNLACSYALIGQTDDAFEALHRAVKLGYRDFQYLERDKDLKSLHQDPRFQTLISKARDVQGQSILQKGKISQGKKNGGN